MSLGIRLCLATALAVACGADSARADSLPSTPPPGPVHVLYASAGVGAVLQTPHGAIPSAQGTLRFTLPFGRHVALEVLGTTGYAIGTREPNAFWARLGLGFRVEANGPTLSPYGAFRLVHLHFASAETWWEHPGASIAGSSSEGLQHSSGMAMAFGVTWPVAGARSHFCAMAEVEGSWIPVGNAPEWFLTTEVGLGYRF
jgi:hypothetical protein